MLDDSRLLPAPICQFPIFSGTVVKKERALVARPPSSIEL